MVLSHSPEEIVFRKQLHDYYIILPELLYVSIQYNYRAMRVCIVYVHVYSYTKYSLVSLLQKKKIYHKNYYKILSLFIYLLLISQLFKKSTIIQVFRLRVQ